MKLNPKFFNRKICPGGGVRANPSRICSTLQGNPGFCLAQFSAGKIWDDPAKSKKLSSNLFARPLAFASGRILQCKIRVNNILQFVLSWPVLFLAVLMTSGVVYAQASMSSEMRQVQVDEDSKKVLNKNSEATEYSGAKQYNPYAKEDQQIASQLQVIADNEDVNYTIVQGDTLTISFKDRGQVNRAAYKVSQTGEVYMPLVGPVKVAGLNRKQSRERIDLMMKEYIRDPRVMIAVNTDGRVMIFGAVGTPGIYNMVNKMTVMEAILSAGSFLKQTAEMSSVIIIRGPVDKPVILKLNLKKMISRGDRTDDINVKPGDFIYVPTSVISNLEKFWDTMYGHLMRWYGLGGNSPVAGNNQWNWGKP